MKILNLKLFFKEENNKGFAFVEFETPEQAKKIMKEYNKKKINGVLILLNWTKLSQKDYDLKHANISNNLYTVKKLYLIMYSLYYRFI